MTSPIALRALTYDGTDIQTADLQIFFEVVRGLAEPPTVRGTDTTVPTLGGRIEGTRVNDVLEIELRGPVRADPTEVTTAASRASFAVNRAVVRALFATNRARAPLVATLEDGTQLTIMARPTSAVWVELVPAEYADVSIELEGYDDWAVVP